MTNVMANHQSYAGTIALMKDSRLVFRQGYGWGDSNLTSTIHPDSLFRLASVSKPIAGSAIHKLVNGGKLSYSTPVYSYLGIQPMGGVLGDNRITNITVQHLLDHAGGWTGGGSGSECVFGTIAVSVDLGLNYPASASDVIRWKFAKPLDFAPGASNVYSNFGYQVLGRVVEKASGKNFTDYIQQDLLGLANVTNAIGFTNVVQSRTRARDLAPWEIWNVSPKLSFPETLPSAVDYPTNILAHWNNGAYYFESFDSFGGLSASAIGLCKLMLTTWVGGDERVSGSSYGWGYSFYGGLPGASTAIYQNISQDSSTTNGLEFAVLFNSGVPVNERGVNGDALDGILSAVTNIASWPTNGGGEIQWAVPVTNVVEDGGSLSVQLVRSGLSTLPVKVSYTTYGTTASTSNYVPVSGIASFAAGETTKTVTVQILNTGNADPQKGILLELISASGGAWLGKNLTCVVAIQGTNTPPAISTQPQSQNILVGATAAFSTSATGTPPLLFQWRKDGIPIVGATNSAFFLSLVQASDAGGYSVVVSNSLSSVTSFTATLTISNQPVSSNSVPAPTGLVSWWTGDGTANDRVGTNHGGLQNGMSYGNGMASQSFVFDGADDYVSVQDTGSWAFGTNDFAIDLWANFSVIVGSQAFLANDEGGGNLNKWIFWRDAGQLRFHINGPGGSANIGSAAFSPSVGQWSHLAVARNGSTYRFYINGAAVSTNVSAAVVPDANALLTIGKAENNFFFNGRLDDVRIYNRALAASEIQAIYAAGTNGMAPPARPSLSSQPDGQTLLAGTSATFSVQAAGSTPLRYQWLRDGSPISGATNAVYTIATAQVSDAGNYSVIVTNALGTVTSSNAVLAVYAAPQIFAQPLSQTVPAGQNVVLSVAATGSPAPEYRWRYNGVSIAGATNSVLSLPSVAFGQSGTYSVLVSNVVGTITSANAVLTVLSPPIITTEAQSQTVLSGSTVTLSVAATGSPPLAYQWRKDGVNIGGATGTNHTLSNLQTNQTGTYSVVVSNAYGTVTNSALITVTPGPLAPAIVTQPQSQTARAGTNVTFTVLATGYPAPDYQWVKNGAAVSGVNAPSLTLTNVGLADAGSYYVQIYNASGVTNSAVATLIVQTLPTFTTQPQPAAVTPGNAAVFTVAADGVPAPALSWFKDGTRLTNSASISGATTATLLAFVSGTNQAGSYFAVATNAAGATTSSVVSLTVLLPPTITQQPTNVVLLRTNPASVLPALFSVSAAGTAPLSYQWRFNGGSLPNQTNPTLALPNVARADGGSYSVVVTNQVGSATSTNALLRVRVPQRLLVPERLGDGRLRLVFADDLGTLATGSDQPFVEVQFATNMVGTNFAWQRLTNAIVTTNGALQIEEPPSLAVPRRFYRVIER